MTPDDRFLYHYTTFAGLKGILETRSLWATDFRYVNDAKEFRHAVDVALSRIQEAKKRVDTYEGGALDKLAYMLDEGETPNVYVFSLTEKKDDLSQWRGYSMGSGVAVQFEAAGLETAAARSSFQMLPCIYEYDEQVALMDEFIEKSLAVMRRIHEPRPTDPATMLRLGAYSEISPAFSQLAVRFKDRAFRDEAEWRLVWQAPESHPQTGLKVRVAQSLLVPYFDLPIGGALSPPDPSYGNRAVYKTPIFRCIVGPNQNPYLAKEGIRAAFASNSVYLYAVENSPIPLRNL